MTRQPVRLVVEWAVPSGQGAGIVAALQDVMLATRRDRACRRCVVSARSGEPLRLRYQETWETEAALRQHLRSEQFEQLARLVESAIEAPRVQFWLPTGRRGLDYVFEARGA
jgi:quinol monooxygenase YgiN